MDVVTLGAAKAAAKKSHARGDSIGTRLRLASASAFARNSLDLGVMASPPTITTSTTHDATLPSRYRVQSGGALAVNTFRYLGGNKVIQSSLAYRMWAVSVTSGGNISATTANTGGAVEFWTDAPKIEIAVIGGSTKYQIEVDDQKIAAAGRTYEQNGSLYFITLDFTTSKTRKIRYEMAQADGAFEGAAVATGYSVWAAPLGLRVACVGDSQVQQTGTAEPNGGYTKILGKLLGWQDVWGIAIGGTGFVTTIAGGNTFGSAARVADTVTCNPDLVMLHASQNDIGVADATVTAAALAAFRAYRTALPNTPIICTGLIPGTAAAATALATEAAVKAAFDAWGDAYSWWIPVLNTAITNDGKPWIYGTGRVGATNGTGNTDILIGPTDASHLNDSGHPYLARRYAQQIRETVLTSSRLP